MIGAANPAAHRAAREFDCTLLASDDPLRLHCISPQPEASMAHYVMLANWTDQGVRAAKDTVKRVAAARQAFEKQGARIKDFYWTLGQYDCVISIEAPNDETVA